MSNEEKLPEQLAHFFVSEILERYTSLKKPKRLAFMAAAALGRNASGVAQLVSYNNVDHSLPAGVIVQDYLPILLGKPLPEDSGGGYPDFCLWAYAAEKSDAATKEEKEVVVMVDKRFTIHAILDVEDGELSSDPVLIYSDTVHPTLN